MVDSPQWEESLAVSGDCRVMKHQNCRGYEESDVRLDHGSAIYWCCDLRQTT